MARTLDWRFSIRNDSPSAGGATRSTAALLGNDLYVGYGAGVYDLDATTGAKIWKTEDFSPTTPEVISSPAIAGPPGDRVLFIGDVGGAFRAYSLAGRQLWSYDSGAFVYRLNPELGTVERSTASFGPFFVERASTAGRGDVSFCPPTDSGEAGCGRRPSATVGTTVAIMEMMSAATLTVIVMIASIVRVAELRDAA